VVSVLDLGLEGPRLEPAVLFGPELTQPSILKWSVNEYRLRLGRFKAGICATLLGARHVPERFCGGL